MPEASGDPPEIRCCCAVHSIRRERHPAAAQEQSTGLFHLNVRISGRIKKPRCQKASGFLVARWRFELQTHCLKGSCSTD